MSGFDAEQRPRRALDGLLGLQLRRWKCLSCSTRFDGIPVKCSHSGGLVRLLCLNCKDPIPCREQMQKKIELISTAFGQEGEVEQLLPFCRGCGGHQSLEELLCITCWQAQMHRLTMRICWRCREISSFRSISDHCCASCMSEDPI